MNKVVIVGGRRTPQGRFLGALSNYSGVDLAVKAGEAVFDDIGPEQKNFVDQVIIGNVLAAGQGMNIARQVGVRLGVPVERIAYTVNMMCASGLQAVILAAQAIITGEANVVLCGGTESMSNAPYLLQDARRGFKLGNATVTDTLLNDGLIDSFSNAHMGLTVEDLAEDYQITRKEQDLFALESQCKYQEGAAEGKYNDELTSLPELEVDEHPRPETSFEELASLKPVFSKEGTVTPGNASGINDGAAMMLVCNEKIAVENNWKPLAELFAWASVGCNPAKMGLGPVYAVRKLCNRLKCSIDVFDTVELNEAFAVQSIACMRELDLNADHVNPEGGAIALGHPIGTSGARILLHLAHRIGRGLTQNGLATLCVGGGMGLAAALRPV